MLMNSADNKRIAKNTILLYIRTFIAIIIALYTSRVVLNALGQEGYGLYSLVAGVVTMFSFMNASMNVATTRFITIELGNGDYDSTRHVFSTCLVVQLFIALIIFVLAETIGLWFINTHLLIPEGQNVVANIIYQCAVISLCFNVVSVPYSASLVAYEHMGYFAAITIVTSILKLVIVLLLDVAPFDRVAFYACLVTLVDISTFLLYFSISKNTISTCVFKFKKDIELVKRIFSFSVWSLLGQFSFIAANQGTNVLINRFFTITMNATMGIATQVNTALTQLTSSFQTAFSPQITKLYASKNYDAMNILVYRASKFSLFLILFFAIPIIFHIDYILALWLVEVPLELATFCVLIISSTVINTISSPLWVCISATGKVKTYNIFLFIIYILDIPILYLLFYSGCPASYAMVLKIIISIAVLLFRLLYCVRCIPQFSMRDFVLKSLLPIICVSTCSILCASILTSLLPQGSGLAMHILWILLTMLCVGVIVVGLGLSKLERCLVLAKLKFRLGFAKSS